MRSVLMASAILASLAFTPRAQAAGCVSGAVVGGVAGHMVGHGKLGAVAGCVAGHHKAKKDEEARKREEQPQEQH
jgi:uncharacterized protein YcfJ